MEDQNSPQRKKNQAVRRIVLSEELFCGATELVIQHRLDFYRLIITKAGKLILNK